MSATVKPEFSPLTILGLDWLKDWCDGQQGRQSKKVGPGSQGEGGKAVITGISQ